jgi:hypothetical protein
MTLLLLAAAIRRFAINKPRVDAVELMMPRVLPLYPSATVAG